MRRAVSSTAAKERAIDVARAAALTLTVWTTFAIVTSSLGDVVRLALALSGLGIEDSAP
jgi:hypothetical protein